MLRWSLAASFKYGWIYAIPDDVMAIGAKGEGVRWRGAARDEFLGDDDIAGLRSFGKFSEAQRETLKARVIREAATEPVHCSAYGYLKMVKGVRSFGVFSRCHPWDHAAGIRMIEEIGGAAKYLDDGSPYEPTPTFGRPLLVAREAAFWDAAKARFDGV